MTTQEIESNNILIALFTGGIRMREEDDQDNNDDIARQPYRIYRFKDSPTNEFKVRNKRWTRFNVYKLLYHLEYNWIMQAITYLEIFGAYIHIDKFYVDIVYNYPQETREEYLNRYECRTYFIVDSKDLLLTVTNRNKAKIDALYLAVVNFIKWYNNKKDNESNYNT